MVSFTCDGETLIYRKYTSCPEMYEGQVKVKGQEIKKGKKLKV